MAGVEWIQIGDHGRSGSASGQPTGLLRRQIKRSPFGLHDLYRRKVKKSKRIVCKNVIVCNCCGSGFGRLTVNGMHIARRNGHTMNPCVK
jgi:hypothetical protein